MKSLFLILAAVLATSHAYAGPGRGGGGNLKQSTPATLDDVETAIYNSTRLIRYVLNRQERDNLIVLNERPDFAWAFPDQIAVGKLVLSGNGGVFSKLTTMTFDIRRDAPCKDPQTGEDTDAGYDPDKNQTCFSLQRILNPPAGQTPLMSADVLEKIVVLLGHELAHSMGANEAEARLYEKMVQGRVTQGFQEAAFQTLSRIRNWTFELEDGVKDIGELRSDTTQPFAESCRVVDQMVQTMYEVNTMARDHGFQVLSFQGERARMSLYFHIGLLKFYCANPKHYKPMVYDAETFNAFQGREQISVLEFAARTLALATNPQQLFSDRDMVLRPSYGNVAALASELSKIRETAVELRSAISRDEDEIRTSRTSIMELTKGHVQRAVW